MALLLVWDCPSALAAGAPDIRLDIAPQRLETAVQHLALQAGRQIIFGSSVVAGARSHALSGRMTVEVALRRLLRGTGLAWRQTSGNVILIERATAPSDAVMPARAAALSLTPLVITAERRTDPVSFLGDVRVRPTDLSIAALVTTNPGFSAEPAGSGQQALVVRGVGMAGEATTMVYFADVPISGPSGTGSDASRTTSDLALVDIGRVQVARTARSSEHGTGALAGEIEIAPEEPHLGEWGGNGSVSATAQQGGAPGMAAASTLNIPLGETAALRASAYVSHEGGYVDDVRTGARNVNDDDIRGLRLIARVMPQSNLDISAMLAWQHRRIADTSAWFRALGPYRTDRYFAAPTTHDFLLGRLKAEYGTGDVHLTSITAAYRWKLDRRYDRTNATLLQGNDPEGCQRYFSLETSFCDAGQAQDFGDYAAGLTPSLLHIPIVSTRILQEVRLANDATAGFGWVAGVMVDHRTEKLHSQLSSLSLSADRDPIVFGNRKLAISRDQAALFGTLSWRDTSGLLLSLGLRYDHYRVSSQNDVVIPNILSGSIESWPRTVSRTDGVSARIHIDLPITAGATWHTQLTRSLRPAGVNTASVLPSDRRTFDSDSLWGVEMGIGLRLGEATDFTVTGYMNDWRDMQYRALSENRSHAYLVNVGNAMIHGAEVELVSRPLPGLTAKLEASLIRAKLIRVSDAADLVGGARAGDEVPFVPDHRLQASLSQDWSLGNGNRLTAQGDWQYQSGSWSTFNRDDPDFVATAGFTLLGASLSWRRGGDSLSLRARNIFNAVANLRSLTNGYGVGQTFSSGPRAIVLSWNRHW